MATSIEKQNNVIEYLPAKQKKALSLVRLSQELIQLDDPEDIFDFLLSAVEELFPGFSYACLFEFDRKSHVLRLVRSRKEKNIAIKEKKGSGIEKWMLRQNSSVLVEDIRRDFRFDSGKIDGYRERNSLAFLAGPLSIGEDFFGIIRIESGREGFFSHEDLRLLNNICDLGAVVLERASLLKRVRELAVRDPLTSLYLRSHFNETIKLELERARETKSHLALIMLDIDDFKKINDTHGHIVGDLILKKLAEKLRQFENNSKITTCRHGGEEFMVLIAETDKNEAIRIAESIREKISLSLVIYRRNKVGFTVSVGLALYPDDCPDSDGLVNGVDQMLYQAKKEGKNKVCFLP